MPGSGKSTVVAEVVEELKRIGWTVGGVVCPDMRENGVRAGFMMIDLMTGASGVLSSTIPSGGPRVGKYYVNTGELDSIGATAINHALSDADLVVIDEIGPMELKSKAFGNVVQQALKYDKDLLAVVHHTLTGRFSSVSIRCIDVMPENRDEVVKTVVDLFLTSSMPSFRRSS